MAEIAIVPEMFIFINAKFVTTVAFKSDVLAAYAITVAFAEVIKGCFFPVFLVMACIAHWPVLALVYIVFLMAVEAKSRHLFGELAAFVTSRAFGLFVFDQQR
jgi:TctA family transporter